MNPRFLGQFIILLLVASQASFAAIRTVSKGADAQYSTVQAALDAAQEGDEIVIQDFETYNEQVTIKKNRIVLKSLNPALAKKPIIKYQDKTNVGPKTGAESKIEDKITFDQNGAVRVMRAQGVTIEGIILDGGGAAPFAYSGIWNDKDALFHGNSALTLFVAGDVTVRNCELRNAYFGIYIKDRNEGGIFANSNPADLEVWRVVPLSGFAKTGNHIFEYNKIHDNSWGTFFESTWDLGSTIRYNLYYENHHTSTLGPVVAKLPDGSNQPGGAFLFKDMILSPVAIYNNTFWHNHTIFAAHWKAGSQHLIFNNIYGEPYIPWAKNPDFQNPFMDFTGNFVNRMKNCLFAGQMQAPDKQTQNMQWNVQDTTGGTQKQLEYKKSYTFVSAVRITNEIIVSEKAGQDFVMTLTLGEGTTNEHDTTKTWHEAQAIQPGALITGTTALLPYPKAANNRWLEPKFQSTDPTDARFLTPDWDDPVMKQYIVDQGWPEAGIRDGDGSIADIGAISYTKRQEVEILIKPTEPIYIKNTEATASFNLSILSGVMNNPVIKYIKWIDLPTFKGTEFGPNATKLTATNISSVTPSRTTAKEGLNRFTFSVAARNKNNAFGFLEIVVQGTNEKGDTITSNVGLLPYRDLAYKFEVKIYDLGLTQELHTVHAGDIVMLKVIPKKADGTLLTSVIDTAEASLGSNYILLDSTFKNFAFPRGFKNEQNYPVIFTKVPPDGSTENVSVSGKFLTSTTDSIGNAIRGTSDTLRILPGPADHVLFFDPASKGVKLVYPGVSAVVIAKVYDKFGNIVDKSNQGEKTVTLKSSNPEIGDVDGSTTANIDDTGAVNFKLKATGGEKGQTFPIIATLPVKGTSDTAIGKIGAPRDRFVILYSDTLGAKDESAKIEGICGDRYPVTIIATNNGTDILTVRTDTPFDIDFPDNSGVLNAYLNPNDTLPISQYHLTNGKAKIWITSTGNSIDNGEISIYSSTDPTIVKNSRLNIFFTAPQYRIKSGAYYADNGFGQVNRLEIYYEDTLKSAANLPDSIELYWPNKNDGNKKMEKNRLLMTLDPANNKHVTVKLETPFDTSITASSGGSSQLGTVYWRNPTTPTASSQVVKFNIADSVGPLLSSAIIVERIGAGDDTLFITFTESVPVADIEGTTLRVIKNNGADKIDLTVKAAADIGNNVIRIVVPDGAANSPAAGDSLKIIPAGSITDQYNNKAHQDNRPVKIKIKQIPADILSAAYYDKNADGIVDTLSIKFNKNVDKDYFKVFAVWPANSNRVKDSISGARIGDGAAMELIVNLSGAFTTKPTDVTSGALDVVVRNTEFPGVKSKPAEDKAAPVLVSADYYPGIALSITQSAPDTLKVVFSEAVTSASDPEPFVFKDKSSTYTVTLESPVIQSANGIQSTYYVKNATKFPVNGDSVNIKVGKIADKLNNFQDNASNKRVALNVHPVRYKLNTRMGPNPFTAGEKPYFVLKVVPMTKMKESLKLDAKLNIYDEMGSLVMDSTVNNSSDTIMFKWDGRNKHGRLVGAGSYVGILEAKDLNPLNKVTLDAPPRFLIGVRR